MSQNKLLLKDKVLTCGGADRRVVLDYESCLVYQYSNPENILAVYESGKGWIIRNKPYYSSGGWGRSDTGDAEGHYLIENTMQLLGAIDAAVYEINSMTFLSNTEVTELTKTINAHNRLVKSQNALAKKLGEVNLEVSEAPPIPNFKLSQKRKGSSLKGTDAIKTALVFETALQVFIAQKGKQVSVDGYVIKPNLVTQGDKTVAFRDTMGQVFMNSEVLDLSQFEKSFMGGQSMVQKTLREMSKYNIPFNVLASAKLKLSETKILEQGPESDHKIKTSTYGAGYTERHFTGALLLENAGRKFLMDIDRIEIENGLFNAFFVEVSPKVTSILEAYESMKPDAVRDAENKGVEVKRQGEWFFIPTDKILTVHEDKVLFWDREQKETKVVLRHNISHGKGRPNSLSKPVGFGALDSLVCGVVKHSGREHADLDLGTTKNETDKTVTFKLWQVIGNTTVSNFTITGDID